MKKTLVLLSLTVIALFAMASTDIKLTWTHGGSSNDVSGYNLYYGPSSRNYTNHVSVGYVTNTVISNLPPGAVLFFSGTTLSVSNLETFFGNEVSLVIPTTTNQLPSAVKDFVLTKVVPSIY